MSIFRLPPRSYTDLHGVPQNPLSPRLFISKTNFWQTYCIPFFLVELLTICCSNDALREARNSREDRRGLPSSGVLSPSYISAALTVAFLLYFQASAAGALITGPHAHLGQYMGSVALVCWGPVLAFAFVVVVTAPGSIGKDAAVSSTSVDTDASDAPPSSSPQFA